MNRDTVARLLVAALLFGACDAGPGVRPAVADAGGSIRTNTGGEPTTIDPQRVSFVNEVAHAMMVFEPLMTLDPGTLRPVPAAAESEPVVSADGLSYRFTLREGLRYSDGVPVTAADFRYGFARLCDPATDSAYAFTGYVIVGCELWNRMDPASVPPAELAAARAALGIEARGEREIVFHLREPAPYFTSIAALWVGAPARERDVLRGGDRWTEPATYIGNGPFKLVEWRHNDRLVFERNERYRKPVGLARWTKVMLGQAVAAASYRNDELDFLDVAADGLRAVQEDEGLRAELVEVGGSCTTYIGFNNTRPPFSEQPVRLAFARAIDREAFVREVPVIGEAGVTLIPPGRPGYDREDGGQSFDAAAARALLEGSRFAGTPELAGASLSYQVGGDLESVQWLQGQWRDHLGVEVRLDPVDASAMSALLERPATAPHIFFGGWCEDYPDPQNWLPTLFHSSSTVTSTGYASSAFDALTRAADRELDAERRAALYRDASRLLSRDAPVAFLLHGGRAYLKKPWVAGVTDSSLDFEYGALDLAAIRVERAAR